MDSSLKKRKIKKEIEAKKNKSLKHHDEEANTKDDDDDIKVNECEEGFASPPTFSMNKFNKK